ncbi:MAG: aspartate carbamoyltransferase catalytic subunit [Rickettsiales bacterium]|jgi:aspartate carbamoyltransferase catalytic subunit
MTKNKHLISINDLSDSDLDFIFKSSKKHFENNQNRVFKDILKGKALINFFFENSTRTRTSFEIAAKNLGADVVNIDISLSSLKKGETIIDTAKTINAMNPDFVAIRHNSSGIVELLKNHIDSGIINAGDGTNEHPSQALLDAFTILQHKGKIKGLEIAICGDILHSRVARSNLLLLTRLGANIRLIMPPTLLVKDFEKWVDKKWGVKIYQNIKDGIKNADVVMMLRIQQERMFGCFIPSPEEFYKIFGLNHDNLKLAKKDAIVLHPGPINRDVEISSALADDENISLILNQVENGVAVRQAILEFLNQ